MDQKLRREVMKLESKDIEELMSILLIRQSLASSDQFEVELYTAISKEASVQLKIPSIPYPLFKKINKKQSLQFSKAVKKAKAQIELWFGKTTVLQRASLFSLIARLLVQGAHRMQKRVEGLSMLQAISLQLSELPILLDNAFPGYLSSGLMPMVLQKRMQGETSCPNILNRKVTPFVRTKSITK